MKKWFVPISVSAALLAAGWQSAFAAPPAQPSDYKPPAPAAITKELVQKWIETQGKEKGYYFPGLHFEQVNLDEDKELEIVATIDGAVHLGNFFVLDKQAGGYKLIAERDWKVENISLQPLAETDGKRLFKSVERTGGTGLDEWIDHLWYVEKGAFHEAWEWTTKERSFIPGSGEMVLTVGGYQLVDEPSWQIYAWTTTHLLNGETTDSEPTNSKPGNDKPVNGEPANSKPLDNEEQASEAHVPSGKMNIFTFDGTSFVASQAEPYPTLLGFLNARVNHNDVQLLRYSTDDPAFLSNGWKGSPNPHLLHFTVEKEWQAGNDWHYQVLLFAGNNGEATQMTREKITVSKQPASANQAASWLVTKAATVAASELGTPTIPGSDSESLEQVKGFLNAQMKRDIDSMKAFMDDSMNKKLASADFQLSLIGLSNPHLETYDIIKAEAKGDTIQYTVNINLAVTDMGFAGSERETIALKKLNGTIKVIDIQME